MDTIKVSKRDFSLKAKQLRNTGMVPGSVYGGPLTESICIQMKEADARKLLLTNRVGSRLTLELNGKSIPVQLKEKQWDIMQKNLLRIDFQALKAGQKVNSVAHVVLLNTEKVTAMLEHMMMDIPYSALPKNMVDTVYIDVDGMKVGTCITVGDIKELNNDDIDLLVGTGEPVLKIAERVQAAEETEEAAVSEENSSL